MDIDDILASVTRSTIPPETLDLQELTRAWVAERVAPELLPYPDALMGRIMERIRLQIELVEEQTGNMDPKTNFRVIIIQTELERFKFLVRSYLRARIAKTYIANASSRIDAHPHHTLHNLPPTHLSPSERQYLHTHLSLLSAHYHSSFISSFPPQLQRLDDTAGGISMVDKPDEEKAVFVRCLRDCEVEGVEESVKMRRGDVWVLRWRFVRDGVGRGNVELI